MSNSTNISVEITKNTFCLKKEILSKKCFALLLFINMINPLLHGYFFRS